MEQINVLLVDDSAEDLALGTVVFEELGRSVQLHCVTDPEQAMAMLDGEWGRPEPLKIDLLITDWVMPDDGGIKLITHMRSHDHLELIPIVVLTGTDRADEIDWAYRAGANTVVRKPDGVDNYRAMIDLLLQYWGSLARLPTRG